MKKAMKKLVAGALVGAMFISGASTVFAGGDTMAPRPGEQGYLGENQPTYHGHNLFDVMNWSPETDEYAQFMRAKVPLQERNEAFKATQANPMLDQRVQELSLTEDYGNEFFDPYQYNDDFAQYVFNFWQYQDIRASWHGTVTDPTPADKVYNPEAGWWERDYEFGIINIPNPAYTNAAHKNGVMSIGCIFFPRNQHTDDYVWQDENGRFPVADKLVEMAKWYGFDGYFINAEEGLPGSFMPLYEEFCRAMTSQGIYIQTYASNKYGQNNQGSWGSIDYYNKNAAEFSNWVKGPDDDTIASNSLYMNPDPSKSQVDGSVAIMESLGLDARETVFNTLEAGQTGFSGTRGSLYNTFDENGVPRTAIANLGAGTVYAHLDEQLFGHTGNNSYSENRRGQAEYQKYIIARERNWWSGSLNAPTYEGGRGTLASSGLSHEELCQAVLDATFDPVAVANSEERWHQTWRGMSGFISERSVIDGANFYTAFNTGHGMQYFVDGKVSNPNQWSNINDQDILPTWQWWIDTESENRLDLDFDYGPEYDSGYDNIQIGGYNGSSSLAIFGTVDAKSDIRLYKTDLQVLPSTKLNLTYNKPTETDASSLSLVLYLKDGDGVRTVYVPVEGANKQTDGWVSTKIDLGHICKGETIAAFGVSVDTTEVIENYQINLGEISITDNRQSAPKKVDGLKIDRAFATGEVYLSWNLDDYADVQEYNVWAVDAKGNRTHVGATYDDVFYVKNTIYNPEITVAFQVTAEGISGLESNPVSVAYDFGAVTELTTEAVEGAVNLSWKNPGLKKCASVKAEITLPENNAGITDVYTATFDAKATSGTVEVPVVEGYRYYLRLSFLDKKGDVLAYQDASGFLVDTYCAPYVGRLEPRVMAGGYKLTHPEQFDWWHIWVWDNNGKLIKDGGIRGKEDLTGMPNVDYVEVQLEDFNGNKSERVRVYNEAIYGKSVDKIFTDEALLAIVKEQVGAKMKDVIFFDGVLDLSNSAVVDARALKNFQNIKGINLTGCTALEFLDLSDTSLSEIICEDPTALTALFNVNLNGCRLDLSEGTAAKAFVDAAIEITDPKEDIVTTDPNLSNLAKGGAVSGKTEMFDGSNSYFRINGGDTATVDMSSTQTIYSWKLENDEEYYGIKGFKLYTSEDGENYTEVLNQSVGGDTNTGEFEAPVTGRYFKFEATSGSYCKELELYGYKTVVFSPGVSAENQRTAG